MARRRDSGGRREGEIDIKGFVFLVFGRKRSALSAGSAVDIFSSSTAIEKA
jgi:hypothetical protein